VPSELPGAQPFGLTTTALPVRASFCRAAVRTRLGGLPLRFLWDDHTGTAATPRFSSSDASL